MNSLRKKLTVILCAITLLASLGLGAMAFLLSMVAQKNSYERDLKYIAQQTAELVTKENEGRLTTLSAIANRPEISDPDYKLSKKVKVLASEVETVGSLRLNYIDQTGMVYSSDGTSFDASDRMYFIEGMKGNTYIANPLFTKLRNELVVIYAVPITHKGSVIGVLTGTFDGNELSRMVNEHKFGTSGTAFLVDEKGTMVANADVQQVIDGYNPVEDAKSNKDAQSLADYVTAMIGGSTATGRYTLDGKMHIIANAPVDDGKWFVAIDILKTEVYQDVDDLFRKIIILAVVLNVIGFFASSFLAKRIAKRIVDVAGHMEQISTGDFTARLPETHLSNKDEIGMMSTAIHQMQDNISGMITSMKEVSLDLSASSEELRDDSNEINKLSDTITNAISEVAQGTSLQASELVHINTLLAELNTLLQEMGEHTKEVDASAKNIDGMAEKSSEEMNELNQSVAEISASFDTFQGSIGSLGDHIKEINQITAIITGIANQTNLLALNASIEAARAGESGRGFAVVAEEIGTLAEQSKESAISIMNLIGGIAKDTQFLVEDSAVMKQELAGQVGTIHRTIASFQKIIEEVNGMQPKIQKLKDSAVVIDENKNVILHKVDELSSVSEEISASSEEITASTEEMNRSICNVAQAADQLNSRTEAMQQQIDQFKVD